MAVGTLNLISVAFAILFVGIAVDFAIQFTVRFRDVRRVHGESRRGAALALTGRRVGGQIAGRQPLRRRRAFWPSCRPAFAAWRSSG